MHVLVESLLRLIRPWAERETAEIATTFDGLLPVLAARARIRKVEFEHHPCTATIPMSPGFLGLVVLNLVDNAIDATPEGGRITTGCQADGDEIRITVTDSGTGLPDGVGRIFDEGVTSRAGHAGLGLAVARRLVRDAGGTLTVETAPDRRGCLATVTLPRAGSA